MLNQTAFRFLFLIGCCFVATSKITAAEIRTQYDILAQDNQVYIMADAPLLVYPEETTMTGLLAEWDTQNLTEAERRLQPEYLIIKRLLFSAAGDLDGILSLYAEDDASQADAILEYGEIEEAQATDEMVDDIVFNTKAFWGPYVRIHYKRESDMYIPPWAAYLILVDGEYRLTNMIEGAEFFNAIVDACPYWDTDKFAPNMPVPPELNRVEVFYGENGIPGFRRHDGDSPSTDSIILGFSYSDIEENFSDDAQAPLFRTLLESLLEACTAENQDAVIALYDEGNAARNAENARRSVIQFKDFARVRPFGYVPYGENEAWLYAVFGRAEGGMPAGVASRVLRVFHCRKIDDEWRFALALSAQQTSPQADVILSMEDFGRILVMLHGHQNSFVRYRRGIRYVRHGR